MFNRVKKIKFNFFADNNTRSINDLRKSAKYKCIRVAFMQKLEYAQIFSGRCISYRSRSKISSVVIRNKKYGVEIRFIINNPRLVILK
jgi:ribosomal protein L19